MLSRDEDILKAAEDWRKAGRGVALATVVETWGSAPRPVGSNLVIDNEGNFLGSVSGGCVEGAVVTEAIDVIDSGKPKMLEFGVADETAWNVGLSCGGTIRVYVEKGELKRETRHPARAQCRTRRAARGGGRHRCGERRTAAGEGRRCGARSAARRARKALPHGEKRHGGDRAGPRVSHRARAVAAAGHHRRGAYQPDAGAGRAIARLRRDHRRSAHGLCLDRTFPRREGDRRMAGRGAAAAQCRSLHRVCRAHARSEDRRPGAQARAGARLLLYRRARLQEDPCQACAAAEGGGARATPTSRASMRRSVCPSARCRRPKSPSPSWARSPRGCA